MTHVTCRLRLTAKNRDQLPNPTLGNRVWATLCFTAAIDRYLLPDGPQQQTHSNDMSTVDRWKRRTESQRDRRTDTVPLHRPCRIVCEPCQQVDPFTLSVLRTDWLQTLQRIRSLSSEHVCSDRTVHATNCSLVRVM